MELFTDKNAQLVVKNSRFQIASLFLTNEFGSVSWTINYIYLNPNSYTEPLTLPNAQAGATNKVMYMLQSGTVTLFVDDIPTQIKSGQMFILIQGQKHVFFNASENKSVIVMFYPGEFKIKKKIFHDKDVKILKTDTIPVERELDPLAFS